MSGCSGGAAGSLPPVAVDLASIRCPAPDARTVAEFGRWTRPPEGPLTREKIDELRASEIRKNAAGKRLIAEYERCRGTPPAPATTAKVS